MDEQQSNSTTTIVGSGGLAAMPQKKTISIIEVEARFFPYRKLVQTTPEAACDAVRELLIPQL